MEVCGTHTVSLFRTGVKSLLPEKIKLISGPGCPVCVTSQGYLDVACELADMPDMTIATYGDMIRVPGSTGSLAQRRGQGAEVALVYSTRDAVRLAVENPQRKIVFLAVGFETTTPATAAAIIGFLCPGHVSVIIGSGAYRPIAEKFHKPCVVAGFEPAGMLNAILHICQQVAAGQALVENVYSTVVTEEGNSTARALTEKVFQPGPALWRAMGELPGSGLDLRDEYKSFDALEHFGLTIGEDVCPPGCLCGEVIQGKTSPDKCSLFGKACTTINPIGPCMVSSEGTCAAWYKYGRKR